MGRSVGVDNKAGQAGLQRHDYLGIQFESTSTGIGFEPAVECSEEHRDLVRTDSSSGIRAHAAGSDGRIGAPCVQGESSPPGTESEDGDNVTVSSGHLLRIDGDRSVD